MQTSAHVVAGLDLSLRGAGIAIHFPDGKIITSRYGYSIKKGTERDAQERNLFIASKIISDLRKHKVYRVGIENYAFSRSGRLSALGELTGIIKAQIIVALKIFPVVIGTTSVRSFLMPGVKIDGIHKKKPLHSYLESLGYHCNNEDEYDALAIALIVNVWVNDRSAVVNEQQMRVLDRFDQQIRRTHERR